MGESRFQGVVLTPRGGGTAPTAVPDRRHRGRPLPPPEPDPRDQRRGGLGAGASRRGQGPAQRRAPAPRPVLRPELSTSNRATIGGMIKHRRQRPGQRDLRQDPQPRAGAGCLPDRRRAPAESPGGQRRAGRPLCRDDRTGAVYRCARDIAEQQATDRGALSQAQSLPDRLRPWRT